MLVDLLYDRTLVIYLFIVSIQKSTKPSKGISELMTYLVKGIPKEALVLPKGLTIFNETK